MLKRRDSPYISGRPKGQWYKWKRAPLTLDCVLMYAQRGSGKRSSYYSDYTFGAWTDGDDGKPELVPVGKAYFGFTDEELIEIDRWVRKNTVESFGPVRAVACSRWPSMRCRRPAGTSPAWRCGFREFTASGGTSRPIRLTGSTPCSP
jgi:ATP-dependent DNA ligase